MARPKSTKKIVKNKDFKLTPEAINLIEKLHSILVKEVKKYDKKYQKKDKK